MEKDTTEVEEIKTIISKYPEHFEILTERNKVLCKLTKHELPYKATAIQTYIDGKKFQYYLGKVKKPAKLLKMDTQYSEYFRESKRSSSRLYCTLTKKEINKLPHEIELYITGYKFLKAVARDRERKAKGIVETEEVKEEEKGDEMIGEEDGDHDEGQLEDPYYALSSEGEDDGAEGSDAEEVMIGDDDVIDDHTMTVTAEEIAQVEEGTVTSKDEEVVMEEAAPGPSVGKKRKSKLSKAQKEKKRAKKLKSAGE